MVVNKHLMKSYNYVLRSITCIIGAPHRAGLTGCTSVPILPAAVLQSIKQNISEVVKLYLNRLFIQVMPLI